ncbi:uncharacterized protein LOC106083652 isoform X1 [Stomoxys calcitrans]|uniref:uncharacterized protein LOC106083652 isoform X1 n=1 Tax=Stomoxys calcitrans TaxID=35570 RepID=UPI0027E2DA7E|nr:uncharacterized protein LOC106083652 isoform X1 [Stomoxys calcitrans]
MSQNQSYFWQTTRHNVYLKRSAKLHMLLALMAVLTFSTICVAEIDAAKNNDETAMEMGIPSQMSKDEPLYVKDEKFDVANDLPPIDPTKESKVKAGFLDAFTASISVILFTELGDKTFFIAAIMAMRHPRLIVFTGAISALALMTVLSVVFGMAATIIPKVYTYYISTALFAIFGLKMIYEGYFMKDSDAQEEMEEVQADLRKREDELFRSKRGSDDAKRKNSNSDKEDNDLERGAGASTTNTALSTAKNPEMKHRQRKQLSSNHTTTSISSNNNGCELNKDVDNDDVNVESGEADAFLKGSDEQQHIKMTTFHSSPTLSASALSNQTNQTNCDDTSSTNKLRFNATSNNAGGGGSSGGGTPSKGPGGDVMVHSSTSNIHNSPSSNKLNGGHMLNNSTTTTTNKTLINSNNNSIDSLNGTAGQSNGDLKQFGGGSKKRLERDVSATLIQDPESGVVRKNTKKGAAYLTTRVFMQAFTMTFLAEWGDRSQLTTIILATSKDVYGVITGGVIGHSICTGLAVIGGRMVAAKISVRTVTIVGGIVFLGFALYALIVKPDDI